MNIFSILGVSKDSIAIVFDLIRESEKDASFKLYPNMAEIVTPFLPISGINYEVLPFGSSPGISSEVFFGCATPQVKKAIFTYFNKYHQITTDNYRNIIHSTAYVASSSELGNGIILEPKAVISSQSKIGFGVNIKRGCLIGHHNLIGDFSAINPGVTLSGKVQVGDGCTIGSGTVIKDNIVIGDNTIIGIGSVVTKNIPPNCIAYGNPCKVQKENTNRL